MQPCARVCLSKWATIWRRESWRNRNWVKCVPYLSPLTSDRPFHPFSFMKPTQQSAGLQRNFTQLFLLYNTSCHRSIVPPDKRIDTIYKTPLATEYSKRRENMDDDSASCRWYLTIKVSCATRSPRVYPPVEIDSSTRSLMLRLEFMHWLHLSRLAGNDPRVRRMNGSRFYAVSQKLETVAFACCFR